MEEDLVEGLERLIKKATAMGTSSSEALAFAQAAKCVANAMCALDYLKKAEGQKENK